MAALTLLTLKEGLYIDFDKSHAVANRNAVGFWIPDGIKETLSTTSSGMGGEWADEDLTKATLIIPIDVL